MGDVYDAFLRIQSSTERLSKLRFKQTQNRFSHAMMLSPSEFEGRYLREDDQHRDSDLVESDGAVVDRDDKGKAGSKTKQQDQAGEYLYKASKLLEQLNSSGSSAYPGSQQRHAQYTAEHERLAADLERLKAQREALDSRATRSTEDEAIATLERAIKVEELEVIALRATNEERQHSLRIRQIVAHSKDTKSFTRDGTIPKSPEIVERASEEPLETKAINILTTSEVEAAAPTSSEIFPEDGSVVEHDLSERSMEQEPISMAATPLLPLEVLQLISDKVHKAMASLFDGSENNSSFEDMLSTLEQTSDRPGVEQLHALECRLLYVFLSAIANTGSEIGLSIQMQKPPPAVSLGQKTETFTDAEGNFAMVSMNDLKRVLVDWSQPRNYPSDLVAKAIYSLLARGLIKIDRRMPRDPMIYLDP